MPPVPTLITPPAHPIVNPGVVVVEGSWVYFMYPDGTCFKLWHAPEETANRLRDWLTAHLVAVGALEEG